MRFAPCATSPKVGSASKAGSAIYAKGGVGRFDAATMMIGRGRCACGASARRAISALNSLMRGASDFKFFAIRTQWDGYMILRILVGLCKRLATSIYRLGSPEWFD